LEQKYAKLESESTEKESKLTHAVETYRRVVQEMQTRKEGLLRKQNRSHSLFGSKWQVTIARGGGVRCAVHDTRLAG
jgi:hypothetical protein